MTKSGDDTYDPVSPSFSFSAATTHTDALTIISGGMGTETDDVLFKLQLNSDELSVAQSAYTLSLTDDVADPDPDVVY